MTKQKSDLSRAFSEDGAIKTHVGGQALIEGVMMRGPKLTATAVRDPNGKIQVETKDVNSISDRYPILKKPMLRGTVSLIESLVIGIRSLSYSGPRWPARRTSSSPTRRWRARLSSRSCLRASSSLRSRRARRASSTSSRRTRSSSISWRASCASQSSSATSGGISRMKDIRRVFQYHGAEHKTIHCYEAGLPLTVENVQKFSRLHPRCGTNFLLIVMLVSIFVFAFLGWPSLAERIASRILLLPVVAGISYEIIRLAGRSENPIIQTAIKPGLWLQYLTTRPPEDDMVAVAIESLKAVLPEEEIVEGTVDYRPCRGASAEAD